MVGCDVVGAVIGVDSEGKNNTTGCVSLCYRLNDTTSGSCTGNGCCQIPIPTQRLAKISYGSVDAVDDNNGVHELNPCRYAFVAEDGAYSFLPTDLEKLEKTTFPVVLDWAVGNRTFQEAQKEASSYACKAENSECYNSIKGHGYLCNCSIGFRGNPYLAKGCQGISISDLFSLGSCKNFN